MKPWASTAAVKVAGPSVPSDVPTMFVNRLGDSSENPNELVMTFVMSAVASQVTLL